MAVTYSIDGGADAAKFNINTTSGVLTFKTAPDFEAPGDANADNIYEVSVKATDAGGASSSKLVKVTVTDVSENAPPQITSAGAVSVKENQTTVMTVTATDPDEGGGTPIPPNPTGWPDATNTGVPAGTSLTVVNGGLSSSSNNQVIDSKDIRGQLRITHSNVTVTKCRISGSASPLVEIASMATPPTLSDCTIEGPNNGKGVRINNGTLRRCKVLKCPDNIELTPASGSTNGVLIEDCYVLWDKSDYISGAHPDVVEADGAHSNVTLRHNNFVNLEGNNSALTCGTYWGAINNFVATNNRFVGGNYTVYLGDSDNHGFTNCTFTNNHLSRGHYGYMAKYPMQGTVNISGNVDEATGAPINLVAATAPLADQVPKKSRSRE